MAPITAADFNTVPTAVAHVARHRATGQATLLDLFRAMWHEHERNGFDERHYVATKLWLDRQAGVQIKGTYHGRWPFLQRLLNALLTAENSRTKPPDFALRTQGFIAAEIDEFWMWAPERGPQHTVRTLLTSEGAQ
ncbi:hypothetical protein MOQ72_34220 [Saccharopolyspora sp. K220]|uniref:hypothetical protein n=1 Tax=Saccharopolyspora soli TaxID=2926618 RepID=UPI001F571A61|nr:hypothetical protein [Saccharopolyspora soli]MCI2422496.1 hypothetical protein [Saccharopolyspora soli]